MSTPDEEIIEFALRWALFDGGEEHMLPTFGLAPQPFYRRVVKILGAGTVMVTAEQRRALVAWVASGSSSRR